MPDRTAAGGIDVLVNRADISPILKPAEEVSTAEWRRILGINLDDTFFCCRAGGSSMLRGGGGGIVNVSSVHGMS